MRNALSFVLCPVLLLAGCTSQRAIVVENASSVDRVRETVELSFKDAGICGLKASNVIVLDADGEQIPSQVTPDGAAVLFQASVAAWESAEFTISKGERAQFDTLAYSRYVPERKDDYAFENDLVAARIYGPALASPRTFGPDIWNKCTDRLIIDKWYKILDYHHNHGEGMDCYMVGGTLGGGALAPYCEATDGDAAEKIVVGDNYATQEHICDGPIRTSARFTYPEFKVDSCLVTAEKTLSLDAGSRFVHWTTTFHSEGRDSLNVVLGAVAHDVVAINAGDNCRWIAFTEKASDSNDPERDGNISIGLVLPDLHRYVETNVMDGHVVFKFKVACGETIEYWTASGWSQGGVESPEAWEEFVEESEVALNNALKVTVRK